MSCPTLSIFCAWCKAVSDRLSASAASRSALTSRPTSSSLPSGTVVHTSVRWVPSSQRQRFSKVNAGPASGRLASSSRVDGRSSGWTKSRNDRPMACASFQPRMCVQAGLTESMSTSRAHTTIASVERCHIRSRSTVRSETSCSSEAARALRRFNASTLPVVSTTVSSMPITVPWTSRTGL